MPLTVPDLRPLLTCTDSTVMVSAARVVGNMVRIAGATLGDSFFTKEIDQALQMLEGPYNQKYSIFLLVLIVRLSSRGRPVQRGLDSASIRFQRSAPLLSFRSARPGQDLDPAT